MAKKRFRVDLLSPEDRQILADFRGDIGFDEVEQTGVFPDSALKGIDPRVVQQVNQVLTRLPSKQQAYQKFIDSTAGDPTELEDQDIESRIEALSGFKDIKKQDLDFSKFFDRERFKQKLIERVISVAGSVGGLEEQAEAITQHVEQNREFPELDTRTSRIGRALSNFVPLFRREIVAGDYSSAPDSTEEVSVLQGILGERQKKAKNIAAGESFLAELPQQQLASREELADELSSSGEFFLKERGIPDIERDLNRRGLLGSEGIRASHISELAGDVDAQIESTLSQVASEDALILADASFRFELQRLEDIDADIADQVAFERNKIRTESENRFSKNEKDLQNQFNLSLLNRRGERSIRDQQAANDLALSGSRAQNRNQNALDIGSSSGQILGLGIASRLTKGGSTQPKTAGVDGNVTSFGGLR